MNGIFKKVISIFVCACILLGIIPTFGLVDQNANAISYEVGQIIEFGTYPQSLQDDGTYRVEPVKWRVLENNNVELFLLSEKVLDVQPYHNTSGSITWAECSLRHWLNNDFYNTAFTENEKAMISTTYLINEDNPNNGTEGGADTQDKIFILSYSDSLNANYQFSTTTKSSDTRVSVPSDYAKDLGGYSTNGANWSLRTPGNSSSLKCFVYNDGMIWSSGSFAYVSSGVRPALKINLDSLSNSDGAETSPHFPSGYNFETDKWGQSNLNDIVDEATYKLMYGPSKGKSLYKKYEGDGSHGICYGFTATTAALMKNRDSISRFRKASNEEYISNLSEVIFLSYYESTEFYLNAADFVKLGFIYQFDSDVKEYEKSTKNNLEGLCNAVNAYVNGTGEPLIINMHDKKEGGWGKKNAHSIFPIGISYGAENITVYIYDSNSPTVMQELVINSDYSSWNYTPSYRDENYDLHVYNSEENGAYIDYSFPADEIYNFAKNTQMVNSRYMSYLNLLISSGYNFDVLVSDERKPDIIRLDELIGNTENPSDEETQSLYWVEDGYTKISLVSEEDTDILVSDVYSSIEASAFAGKTVDFDFTDGMKCELLDVEADKSVSVTLTTYTDESETEYLITGISNGGDATVSMNENIIEASGLNNVHVQLLADGEEKDEINAEINNGENVEFTVSESTLSSNVYEVVWNVDGMETKNVIVEGSAIIAPESPVKVGYTFTGWTPQIPDVMSAEDLIFTAIWKANSYDAVFDANGGKWADGSKEKAVSTSFDSQIDAPEAPAKQGYVFSLWSPEIGIMDDINGKKFVAEWIPATDTRYTVETYTMNTAGEYEKSSKAFSGVTGESATAEYNVTTGFTLNTEKSILNGTIAADSSLVLKVYIDRNAYTFTTVVDGVSSSTAYLYGSMVSEPVVPSKSGHKFIKWSGTIPEVMPAENVTLTAVFEKSYICPECSNEILGEDAINDHIASETKVNITGGTVVSGAVAPGATITVKAEQIDGKIFSHWEATGATVTDDDSVETTIVLSSGKITITAVYDDCDCKCHQGGIAGFFFKIVLFFQKLFGNNLECFCGAKH